MLSVTCEEIEAHRFCLKFVLMTLFEKTMVAQRIKYLGQNKTATEQTIFTIAELPPVHQQRWFGPVLHKSID